MGHTLDSAPGSVKIWFDGAVEPVFSSIRVEDDNKRQVDKGDGHVNPGDNTLLEVSLPPLPVRAIPGVLECRGPRWTSDGGGTFPSGSNSSGDLGFPCHQNS